MRRAFERASPHRPTRRFSGTTALRSVSSSSSEACASKLEEAVREPDDVAALRSLGFVFTNLGDHGAGALKYDARAVEFAPYHPVAWRSKGIDLFHLQRYEEALYAFDQARKRAPGRPEMWQAKGVCAMEVRAVCGGRRGVRAVQRPWAVEPRRRLARARRLARGARAAHGGDSKCCERPSGSAPERLELWALLGRTYRELGNAQAAEHAFRRGFDLEAVRRDGKRRRRCARGARSRGRRARVPGGEAAARQRRSDAGVPARRPPRPPRSRRRGDERLPSGRRAVAAERRSRRPRDCGRQCARDAFDEPAPRRPLPGASIGSGAARGATRTSLG